MGLFKCITRTSIQKYTLLLCVGYLLVVFLFHARLQFRGPSVMQNAEDLFIKSKALKGGRTPGGLGSNRIVHTLPPPPTTTPLANKHLLNPILNRSSMAGNTFQDEQQRYCVGPRAEKVNQFQIVFTNVFIYSAYWDNRENDFDNHYEGVKVRFISAIGGKGYRPVLKCLWIVDGIERSTLVTYYEMCENHNRRWGGFILSCGVPPELQDKPKCSVRVSGASNVSHGESTRVPLFQITPLPLRYNFGMCVPPLFGNVSSARLIEFFEFSLMLGVEHIMIYNFRITETVNQTLQYYVKQGLLRVIPWALPNIIDKTTWYHGQIMAVQDCLYRYMSHADFLTFNDIDEFIIPHSGSRWADVVERIDSKTMCGFKFSSAFFNPRFVPVMPNNKNLTLIPSLLTSANLRSAMLSNVRTKCMVKPHSIFEMGIHHISKPILASFGGVKVDPSLAVLHHYRPCLTGFGMKCKDQVQDDTALWYSKTLVSRMRNAMDHIAEGTVPTR